MPNIDRIDVYHYRFPLDPPFYAYWDPQPRTSLVTTVVRVRAGDLEGVGSSDAAFGLEGQKHHFIGQNPLAMERHVHLLDNLQFLYGRMWALEIALWDLCGQITGQPLWQLLGGDSPEVPVYASTGERRPVDERAASAVRLRELGFPALKIRLHAPDPMDDLPMIRAVREAIGPEMALLIDANQAWQMPGDTAVSWDFKTALRVVDALAELGVYWLEEPLHRHNYEGLARLRERSRVRIAAGEGNREFNELRQYLRHGSLDVYQPDVAWSTGILRGRQIAHEVQAAGAIYSPHTWGDGLVLLANLHVSAAVARAPFIEFPYDPPAWTPARRDFLLPAPVEAENGVVTLSDAPGLGVQLDWDALEQWRLA
ncbi:MAG: mandelate racemase/muconate lactonizing enzyme family protein [Candidatus Promineifilaceae bacterium]|nr:mandelate racemase/muconate lactonizing enzyme family protein [Candidatus Promineifilaceae bacterium]